MVHVLSRRRWGSRWSWTGLLGVLAGLLLIPASSAPAQQPASKTKASAKAEAAKGAGGDDRGAPAPDVADAPADDPARTRRVAPTEVFKDPVSEGLLNLSRLTPLPAAPPVTQNDLLRVEEMAGNPNLPADRALIDRVVRSLAARLTDRKSIQALLEGPEGDAPKDARKRPEGDGGKAIQEATDHLLVPIFQARALNNETFLREYRRSLNANLAPLLKNHLIPRVQAMIVLGEAASPESLALFQTEVGNRNQSLWVKLWALEGITKIRKFGGRFASATEESRVGRTIADFLEKQKDLPWPIQLRALEAMGALRQGALPTEAPRAHMANAAMGFLADPEAKLEVRSEAARALGLMQVNAVPRYNFRLVAHAAGQLAADLAAEINEQYSDNPPRAENATKARYLTALLVGPVNQCFEGVQGESGSGLLREASADSGATKYIQGIYGQVRQLAQASVDLIGAPTKDYKAKKQALSARVAALRDYLQKNPPPNWRLVEKGREFGPGGGAAAGAQVPAPAEPLVQARRGR